ncbi:NAD(P)/FAD-dependent oxidoreductase [Siccirubricoccus sp. KC 17139]|uniref:NAD(P)/FAD-dependent oxidoreductase n=1 Tax=Siccirubricoccus soli TaxID=2899147 RepID=A0ABT1D9Z6_9PROT|nr:NAD(P)/FAD-dependent oxidoreductase [Siccirubricoccus soli]MCO6418767.1 NAD(P)/FAD-dependent oxidoreductase [Siccirubricoccus soli]MCP2684902.1 NAD(P)/FAD-dependent oxidoreductase [Siccirubricoccus soli]
MSNNTPVASYDALIIGAGFSGMYQLHSLRDRLGLKALVLEAGSGVGGTWYWNRYPGARCDSESHSYNYTFSKELLAEWRWSERYPEQPEILRYLNHVADRFDLKRDIRFDTRVTGARYDEAANLWHVTTETGERYAAQYLITAVGCLSTANVPKIPGLEEFAGDWYHTGQWPHGGVDFTGKRVGQIGTGSTGIQAVPVIAAQAGHLTVFQRTANYSVPAHNAPLTPEFQAWLDSNREEVVQTMRSTPNGHPFTISERKVFDVDAEERERIYEAAWAKGGLQFRASFQDLLVDKTANDTAADFIKRKIRSIVKDPRKAAILSDIDHPYAAKRPPIDTHYFEAYNRDNVDIVNLRAEPIERITPNGIRTSARDYPLDIIVFATGFDAMTGPLLRLNIQGAGGRKLAEAWEAGPRNYLGLQVAGFPNLFTITGPGSPSVLCNMPIAIEQHVEWITDCIDAMRKRGLRRIETTEAAMDGWVAEVNRAADATLLPQAKHSWYLGANVPGKPRVFMPYAGGMAHYRRICDQVAAKGYEGFVLSD